MSFQKILHILHRSVTLNTLLVNCGNIGQSETVGLDQWVVDIDVNRDGTRKFAQSDVASVIAYDLRKIVSITVFHSSENGPIHPSEYDRIIAATKPRLRLDVLCQPGKE